MSRFRGRFDLNLDNQGRLSIPAKFRKALEPEAAETFVICRAPDKCLRAFPLNMWNQTEDEIAKWPQTPDIVKYKRKLYFTLQESTLDAQGRITLSPQQIETAGLVKNVTLMGQNSFIEIWDTDRLGTYVGTKDDSKDDYDEVYYKSVEAAARNIGR
jgi:MraZ protein